MQGHGICGKATLLITLCAMFSACPMPLHEDLFNVASNSVGGTTSSLTVTYNGNGFTGGTVPVDPNKYTPGSTLIVANPGTMVRSGYTFIGWNTADNGSGTSYAAGTNMTMGSASITLFAVWTTAPTYTVSYNGNLSDGGTVPTDANSYVSGVTVTVASAGSMTRSGYNFAGWNTAANGSGTPYSPGPNLTMGPANVVLYAIWTTAPTYTVTYNGNLSDGGTVPTDANSYVSGVTVTVASAGSMTRSGYNFAGWNTAANGSGTPYSPGPNLTMGSVNVVLYAMWTTAPTYTVTYNGNLSDGGTVPTDASSYVSGATVTVSGAGSMTRSGYTFNNWNTLADGTGTPRAAGSTFAMGSANVTLYAIWTLIPTYTVTYIGNGSTGGTVPTDVSTYAASATVNVASAGSMTRSGYTFNNWNTLADGTGTPRAAGSTFAMGSANVTLYAIWSPITYTVTYIGNGSTGGTVPTDVSTYAAGATVTVANPGTMARTGYTFASWNTASDGSGTTRAAGSTFAMGSANVTLYAIWTSIATYTVTYYANGGSGSPPTDGNNYATGSTVTVLDDGSLTRSGYVFCGWNTNSGGTGTGYASGNTFTMGTGNVALYAMWCQVSGGTLGTIPPTVTEFEIPSSVTSITPVFQGLQYLTTVTIPASVGTIDIQSFYNCPQLTTIVSFSSNFPVVNGALIDNVNHRLMVVPAQLSGNFTIPAGITGIDTNAFYLCEHLTGITFPASLGFIGSYAFAGLASSIAITIPSTITSVSDHAFYGSSITSITMQSATPPGLGANAFSAPYPTVHVPNAAALTAYQSSSWGSSGVTLVTP